MNRTMRGFGLLMLAMTSACAAEMAAPAETGSAPSAPKVMSGAPAKRGDAPFSRTVRDQLAARGIDVYGGAEPERTTVEQAWRVPGHPMTAVTATNPTTIPLRYSTQLGIRFPHVVTTGSPGGPYIDPTQPRSARSTCSGTLIGSTAVLTAAHCVITWETIGFDPTTFAFVQAKVRAYSILARPRRNGNDKPLGEIAVRKSFWEFSNWLSGPTGDLDRDYDYAVVRLARPVTPAIPAATTRIDASPPGTPIEFAHYPMPFVRPGNAALFHSVGQISSASDALLTGFFRTYRHRADQEPGSSGAGVFEVGADGVIGVVVSENVQPPSPYVRKPRQTMSGFPNQAVMITPTALASINTWISAP